MLHLTVPGLNVGGNAWEQEALAARHLPRPPPNHRQRAPLAPS
ncbi:MAG: hypothetical protein ACKOBW_06950 [Planctomycetota bacterium]